MNKIEEIRSVFEKDYAAFMPYFTMGYPDMETSLDIIEACANNGADLMELGIPFSDPLADGPTIQNSTQISLQNGTTVSSCLAGVKELRERGITIPFILMGYINPIIAYGMEKFIIDAKNAGANGFIIPDLPPNEASELIEICEQQEMAINFLLSPNSPQNRIELATNKTSGFVYLVSIIGITGSRNKLPNNLTEFCNRVRAATDKPIAIGFGISSPEQASRISTIADGVIIGSALINAVSNSEDKIKAAASYTRKIKTAIQTNQKEVIK